MSDAKATTKAAPKAKSSEKKSKVAPAHPKYLDMAVSALTELKERNGSSRQAIVKFITSKYTVDTKTVNKHVKQALKRGVETGAIKHVKGQGASGSFKAVPKATKPKKVQKKTKVAKKPAAKKVAKKAAPSKEKSDAPASPKKAAPKQKKTAAAKPKKEKAAAKPKKEKPTKAAKAKKPAKKASPAKAKKATK